MADWLAMAFAHATLDSAALGPVAEKFVGEDAPGKLRKLAAAGLAPLPPREMLVALYQVWASNDENADTAGKTVEGLPPPVLNGALADRELPPGVLDLLGRKFVRNQGVLEQVVRHPKADDQTLIAVARVCPEPVCDILADNQTRWLACPDIVGSLYQNRHCRMSVIHRIIEFAERQGVDLPLPAMDEIRVALSQSGPVDESRDEVFKRYHAAGEAAQSEAKLLDILGAADVDDELDLPQLDLELSGSDEAEAPAAEQPDEPQEEQEAEPAVSKSRMAEIAAMRPLEKIRTAMLGDKYDRSLLVRDSNKAVSMAAIRSPKIRDAEAVNFSGNRALSADVITYVANRRDWIKLYTVKLNLVMNPKTPLARSMTLLAYLNRGDVQKIARSKGIPSALATAAKRKVQARR